MSFSKEPNTNMDEKIIGSALFQYIRKEDSTENIKAALDMLIDIEENGLDKTN